MLVPPAQPESGGSATPRPAAEVSSHALDDDLVLYDARTAQAHVLNASAARIWQLCDGARSLSAVVESVSTTYDLEPAQAAADVAELMDRLAAAGLLTLG